MQVSPSVDKVSVEVYLEASKPPSGGVGVLDLTLPVGFRFQTCPLLDCSNTLSPEGAIYVWSKLLSFSNTPIIAGDLGAYMTYTTQNGAPEAIANFLVDAKRFGETYNDTTASVAFPEIQYTGPGSPYFTVGYYIPSASSYDWSSYPTLYANDTRAVWSEQLINGEALGRDAVGINYANQQRASLLTFIAGALVGVAGAALLSSIQEVLHANDG